MKGVFEREMAVHRDVLFMFAMKLSGRHQAQAEDLLQEVLLKAWRLQDRYEAGTNAKAWLCTMLWRLHQKRLTQTAWDTRVWEQQTWEALDHWPEEPCTHWTSDPEQVLNGVAFMEEVATALEAVPESYRETVEKVLCGWTPEEVAENFKISKNAARMRLFKGRKHLIAALRC